MSFSLAYKEGIPGFVNVFPGYEVKNLRGMFGNGKLSVVIHKNDHTVSGL